MAGGEPTHLSADAGVYDSVSERMELSNNVRIKNGRFTVPLHSAKFDFKSVVYGSDDLVESKPATAQPCLPIGLRRSTTVRN